MYNIVATIGKHRKKIIIAVVIIAGVIIWKKFKK